MTEVVKKETASVQKAEVKKVVIGVDIGEQTEKTAVTIAPVKAEIPTKEEKQVKINVESKAQVKEKPAPAPVKKKPEVPTLTIGKAVFSVDLSALAEYVAFDVDAHRYFTQENTYKILAHLSQQLPKGSKVADLGTAQGTSALALASNPGVQVSTIDSRKLLPQNLKNATSLPNVSFIQGDIANYISIYADAKIIYLDVHPHDGIQESKIYNELIASEFKGILILDDIHAFEGLNSFWNAISRKKIDATEYGHHSGTGIVVFSPTDLDVVISKE